VHGYSGRTRIGPGCCAPRIVWFILRRAVYLPHFTGSTSLSIILPRLESGNVCGMADAMVSVRHLIQTLCGAHTVQSLAFVREETHSSLFEFVRETPGGAMPASHCRACCVLLALALPSVASIYTSQYSSQTAAWGSGSVGYGVVRRIPRSGGPLRAIRGGADTAGKAQVRDLAMNYSACIISVQPFCVSL